MKLYSVKNWNEVFETAETRKLAHLKWVPAPNKLDGLGYRRLVQQKDRSDLYAAWNLIFRVASKGRQKDRGQLIRDSRPITAEDLALMTGFPSNVFERALTFFAGPDMQWLSVEELATEEKTYIPLLPEVPADSPELPAKPPAVGESTEGRVGNGIDLPAAFAADSGFLKKWDRWMEVRKAMGKKPKDWNAMFQDQIEWLETLGIPEAINTLSHSIRNNYQGLIQPKGNANGNHNATATAELHQTKSDKYGW